MALQDTDLFMVQRGSELYQVEESNRASNVNDDDLFLVARDGVNYKIRGEFVKGGGGAPLSPPIIDTVEVSEVDSGGNRFTGKGFTTDIKCKPISSVPITYDLKATSEGTLVKQPTTSVITGQESISGVWTSGSAAENNEWRSVTYGNGKFVAIAASGNNSGTNRAMYSTDGLSWTAAAAGGNNFLAVGYGVDKFVATATDGGNTVARYSTDAITWTDCEGGVKGFFRGVVYGNGKWVAVSYGGTNYAMHSTDGINWTASTNVPERMWMSVTYADGKFVAVANDGGGDSQVMYSIDDGITWTSVSETDPWQSVTYGDNKFVAVGESRAMYSTDGISWTQATPAEANNWRGVTYGDGTFVAVAQSGTSNRVMYSTDGISWTSASATEDNSWRGVTYGDGKFVAVASGGTNRVMWSATGGADITVLELTDDTDLAQFSPGDDVVQNGGGTPVSSAITNVAPADLIVNTSGTDVSTNNAVTQSDVDKAFDGNPNTYFGPSTGGVSPDRSYRWTLDVPILVPAGVSVELVGFGTNFRSTISFSNGQSQHNAEGALTYGTDMYLTTLNAAAYGTSTQYTQIAGIKVGGQFLIKDQSYGNGKGLTFADETNFANFRVNDVILDTRIWNQDEVWSEGGISTGSWDKPVVNLFDGDDSTFLRPANGTTDTPASYSLPERVYGVVRVYVQKGNSASIAKINDIDITPLIPSSGVFTWVTIEQNYIESFALNHNSDGRHGYLKTIEVDGQALVNFGITGNTGELITINDIDEGSSKMTITGGSWSGTDGSGDPDGEAFVTGPVIPAASGTVSSVDAVATPPTMNLSTSDGRWLVTEQQYLNSNKLNKSAIGNLKTINNVKLYTIFDAEGNISDLSDVDPGYRQMVSGGYITESLDLTFPALLPNGKTPDETLPEGASLCVDVKADNDGGTDFMLHEESGACVTPAPRDKWGPIVAHTPSSLEFASPPFDAPGQAIFMADSDGVAASYTTFTSPIVNVEQISYPSIDTSTIFDSSGAGGIPSSNDIGSAFNGDSGNYWGYKVQDGINGQRPYQKATFTSPIPLLKGQNFRMFGYVSLSRYLNGAIARFSDGSQRTVGQMTHQGAGNIQDENKTLISLEVYRDDKIASDDYANINRIEIDGFAIIASDTATRLTFEDNKDLRYFQVGQLIADNRSMIRQIGTDEDPNAPSMVVQTSSWTVGEQITGVSLSGTGVVNTVSGNNLLLSDSNDEWYEGFYAQFDPVLRADNPAHVAKFEAIEEALEAYPGDKAEFRTGIFNKVATVLTPEELEVFNNG